MNCKRYYNERYDFLDGDIVLFNKHRSFIGWLIRGMDKAMYIHCGIVKWIGKRLFVLTINDRGVELMPLSRQMKKYDTYCIARPNIQNFVINEAWDMVIEKMDRDEKRTGLSLLKHIFSKKNRATLTKQSFSTCSQLCQYFFNILEIDCYKNVNFISPQDFIRHGDLKKIEFIFHS
jgi:hypothetical protein